MTLTIDIVPILKDNYAYVLMDNETRKTAIVDPGESAPLAHHPRIQDRPPLMILNTHHHGDHVGGNKDLAVFHRCQVMGPKLEADKIPAFTHGLNGGDMVWLGATALQVIATPGHTLGHICFYDPASKILLAGDTLFSMGCGRLFEGTSEMMWESLQKLAALPGDTLLYCGHEYTLSNARFALHVEPDNPDIAARIAQCEALREDGQPTLPVTLEIEKKTNPFLRAGSASRFAELRTLKESFT